MKKGLNSLIILLAIFMGTGAYVWYSSSQENSEWKLSKAAGLGDMTQVRRFVARGADVNTIPRNSAGGGALALEAAVWEGQEEVVRFLLDHGANVDACSGVDTPLLAACIKGHYTIAKLLLEHGANPNAKGEGTPLWNAQVRHDARMIELLESYGAKE